MNNNDHRTAVRWKALGSKISVEYHCYRETFGNHPLIARCLYHIKEFLWQTAERK